MKKLLMASLLLALCLVSTVLGAPFTRLIGQNMTSAILPAPYSIWSNATFPPNCEEWKSLDNNTFGGAACSGGGQGDVQFNAPPGSFIGIDLGSGNNTAINSFNITFVNYNTSRIYDPTAFGIWGSNDNSTYTSLVNLTYGGINTTNAAGRTIQLNFTNLVAYRYYKFFIISVAGGNTTPNVIYSELMLLRDAANNPTTIFSLKANDTVTNTLITGLCIYATGSNTTQSICNSTGNTVSFNTTGIYNITVSSIGAGNNLSQTYFNVSMSNINFSTTVTVFVNTSQGYLNISAYRLFLNTSIASFNGTNNFSRNNASTTLGSILLNASNGTNNYQIDVGGNYSQNYTCIMTAPLDITYCNATGIYDNRYTIGAQRSGASILGFNVTVTNNTLGGLLYNQSTTNGSIVFSLLQGYLYLFQLTANNSFSYQNASLPANASTHLYNFSIQTFNTLNLTFYDEQNGSIVNGNGTPGNGPTITVELISNSQSANKTTNNGTLIFSILAPDKYIIRYTAPNYVLKLYQFTLQNNTYTELSLAMLRSSSATAVTVTVVDLGGRTQSNVTVTVLRYNIVTNTYKIVEIFNTNADGVGQFDATLNSEFYYFIVTDMDGTILLQTSPALLYSSTLQLTIGNAITGLDNLFNELNIAGVITFNTTTNIARFVYTDADNTATRGCLNTYQLTSSNKILYNTSCANSSSSTITSPILNTSGSYWIFQGIVTKNGIDYLISTLDVQFTDTLAQEARNKIGLFILLILELIIIAIFRFDIRWMVFLGTLFPMLFSIVGLIPIGLGYTAPLFIIGIAITYIIGA